MANNIVTLDVETYWTTEYSLSKMSFIEYIKDPRFEVISIAIKFDNQETRVIFEHKNVGEFLKGIDWSEVTCVAHNGNEFDFPLLTWVYDCHPKMFVDTLCMARPRHQSDIGGSLKALSETYGLQKKDNTVLLNTKGKRFVDLSLEEIRDMMNYNKIDTDNTYDLFNIFKSQTPKREFILSDMTARMICYPQFECDTKLLEDTLLEHQTEKQKQLIHVADMLGEIDVTEVPKALGSAAKFATVLTNLGVDPPKKISKTTGKPAYAFAKDDPGFVELLEHENPDVQMVAAARLGVKSTLLETRIKKMHTCATLMGGKMPVPLGYHSATTGRWGGRVWNPQNLPRIDKKKAKLTDALRKCLKAPPGYKIVVSDLSNIELRVNHYLWDVKSTQALFDADPKADLYVSYGSEILGKPEADITKDERQLFKVAQLGLGFGAGWMTFKKVAKTMGGVILDDDTAQEVALAWRRKYHQIVNGWAKCQKLVQCLFSGATWSPDPRGLVMAKNGVVELPGWRKLYYPELTTELDENGRSQFVYGKAQRRSKVYSGLMDENLVQAIARDVIAEQAMTILAATGYYPALMVHDELVYVVPEAAAENHFNIVCTVMRSSPKWLPGIVLYSEGAIGDNYGNCKS